MGFLKRAFGGGQERAPDWAAPLDADGHRAFMAALDAELRGRGREYRIEDGFVVADLGAPGMGPGTQLGLINLAQLCAALPRQRWSAAIRDHFDNLVRAAGDEAELDAIATDFERVRRLLKVRLYGSGQLAGVPVDPPALWEVAPGIVAALVYDLPTTVRTVSPAHIAAWPQAHDELVRVSLDNVRRDAVQRQTVPLEGGGSIEALTGDHFFVASHALMLADHVPDADGHGALLAVPTRHAVLYHAIRDASVVRAVNTVITVADGMYRQGPGSISASLYWWRGGTFSELPSAVDEKGMRFAPPESFVEVLNEVVARQPGA